MFEGVQIALLIIAAFTGGAWLGSLVYRRQVNELLQITKDMVELFSGGGKQHKENIEALTDFSTANLIWHFSPADSDMEDAAMSTLTKSLLRMDEPLRRFVMEQMEKANTMVKAANEKTEAKTKKSNGAGTEH